MFGGSSCFSYRNKRLVIEGGMGGNMCKARVGFGIVCRGLPLVLKAMTKMKKIARHLIANQIIRKLFKSICSLSDPARSPAPDQLVTRQPATYSTRTLALGKFGYTRRDLGFTSRADLTSLTRIVNATVLVWPSLNFSHDRVHSSLVCLEFGPSLDSC